jgi:hypothetical protein
MKGRYCPNLAMDDIANYLCKEGYVCGEGLSVNSPTGLTNGDVCSKGKYCPGALIHEMPCPDGFYSNQKGLAICTTCPVGSYCDAAISTEPIACITNSTCDLGEKRQPICPPGMWKSKTGTTEVCTECPDTMYCRAGEQIDKCIAGFICNRGI